MLRKLLVVDPRLPRMPQSRLRHLQRHSRYMAQQLIHATASLSINTVFLIRTRFLFLLPQRIELLEASPQQVCHVVPFF